MRLFFGGLLICAGIIILGNNLYWFDFDLGRAIHNFWPVILIVVGGVVIYNQSRSRSWTRSHWTDFQGQHFSKSVGDINLAPSTLDPGGLRVEHGLGKVTLDLSRTILNPGENRIECSLGIGEIHVVLPANVPISTESKTGIGDVRVLNNKDDGFGPRVVNTDPDYGTAEKKIKLMARLGIGSIHVTRV